MINILLSSMQSLVLLEDTRVRQSIPATDLLVLPLSSKAGLINNAHDWEYCYKNGSGVYYDEFIKVARNLNIPPEKVSVINWFEDSLEEMSLKILSCQNLFLPGGFPDLFIQRIENLGLFHVLQAFSGNVIGVSAGSMIQLEYFHITPNKDYAEFSIQKGIGWLKGFDIEVHYDDHPSVNAIIDKVQHLTNVRVVRLNNCSGLVAENRSFSYVLGCANF